MSVSDENRRFILELTAALSAIGWVTYCVVKTHLIPDMTGVIGYIAALPAIHRASDVLNVFTGNKYAGAAPGNGAPTPNGNGGAH
jgi:hypothetical protein